MATSQEDGALGAVETASEVGNGISAMLALSEQVLAISVIRRFSGQLLYIYRYIRNAVPVVYTS